jgi:hypothetical protein
MGGCTVLSSPAPRYFEPLYLQNWLHRIGARPLTPFHVPDISRRRRRWGRYSGRHHRQGAPSQHRLQAAFCYHHSHSS